MLHKNACIFRSLYKFMQWEILCRGVIVYMFNDAAYYGFIAIRVIAGLCFGPLYQQYLTSLFFLM